MSRCVCCWWWWLVSYSAILRSRADSLRSYVSLYEWLAFYGALLNIHRSGVLTALTLPVPHETAAVSAQVLCTPYNHAPRHFMQSHNVERVCLDCVCCQCVASGAVLQLYACDLVNVFWTGVKQFWIHSFSRFSWAFCPWVTRPEVILCG